MKKLFLFSIVAILFSGITHAQTDSNDPCVTYSFATETLRSLGYGIGQSWSANLEQGDYFTKTFTFTEGVEYDIFAFSEDCDVVDVDIQLITPDDLIYVQDTKVSRLAEVSFTPSYSRSLTIKVKNYRSKTPYYSSKVYFIIGYRN